MPFLIDDLEEKSNSSAFSKSTNISPVDLMSKVDNLNQDVENIVKGIKFASPSETKMELKKTNVIGSVIKDLQVDPRIFFQENAKLEASNEKHELKEVVKAQK
jgi:hypothetical protein